MKGERETEDERRAFLALASIYKIDLLAFGTEQPDGSVTLDWDELKAAVMARMSGRDAVESPKTVAKTEHDTP